LHRRLDRGAVLTSSRAHPFAAPRQVTSARSSSPASNNRSWLQRCKVRTPREATLCITSAQETGRCAACCVDRDRRRRHATATHPSG
jgi:hypothetical protein